MNRTWFMHQRARYIVQQGVGGVTPTPPPAFAFVAPTFNDGAVLCHAADGTGGYYFGGTFTSVTCPVTSTTYTTGYTRLIRCKATGEIDAAFSCPMAGTVRSLALSATGLFVGVEFSTSGGFAGSTRNYIGRVRPATDATPGAVDAWNPSLGFSVSALRIDDDAGLLYVSFSATTVGATGADIDPAQTRRYIAAIGTGVTATLDAWRPDLVSGNIRKRIEKTTAGDFIGGGSLQGLGGTGADIDPAVTRNAVGRFSAASPSSASAWRPDATGGTSSVVGVRLAESDNAVYLHGDLTSIGGSGADFVATPRNRVAAVTLDTPCAAIAWRPDASATVQDVCDTGEGDVVLAGTFSQVGGTGADFVATTRNKLALVSKAGSGPATLRAWDPDVTFGTVFSCEVIAPKKLLVYGTFTAIANHVASGGVRCAVLDLP